MPLIVAVSSETLFCPHDLQKSALLSRQKENRAFRKRRGLLMSNLSTNATAESLEEWRNAVVPGTHRWSSRPVNWVWNLHRISEERFDFRDESVLHSSANSGLIDCRISNHARIIAHIFESHQIALANPVSLQKLRTE